MKLFSLQYRSNLLLRNSSTFTCFFIGSLNNGIVNSPCNCEQIFVSDLSPESVAGYLHRHPDFLELYVLNNIREEDLERWALRKAAHKHRTEETRLNGTLSALSV